MRGRYSSIIFCELNDGVLIKLYIHADKIPLTVHLYFKLRTNKKILEKISRTK